MKLNFTSKEKMDVEFYSPFFPYTDTIKVEVKKGENEVAFDTEIHANAFISECASLIMNGVINFGEVADGEYKKLEVGKAKAKEKSKIND